MESVKEGLEVVGSRGRFLLYGLAELDDGIWFFDEYSGPERLYFRQFFGFGKTAGYDGLPARMIERRWGAGERLLRLY